MKLKTTLLTLAIVALLSTPVMAESQALQWARQTMSQLNANLPMRVDSTMTLENAVASELDGKELILYYYIVDTEQKSIPQIDKARDGVRAFVCGDEMLSDFMGMGLSVVITYGNRNEQIMGEFEFNISDCN